MAAEGTPPEVLIAGAGIGGLTLALSLHQIGVSCRIFESVTELCPLGVGINLQPHAVRELAELGLLDALDALAIRTAEVAYLSRHGKLIWSEPRGLDAGYRWPQFSVHRGELQMLLLRTVEERLGSQAVLRGHAVTGWSQSDESIALDIQDLPAPVRRRLVAGAPRLARETTGINMLGLDRDAPGALDVPIVVYKGDHSPALTACMSRRLAALIPGAKRRIVEGTGHLCPSHKPAVLARHIEADLIAAAEP